MLMEKSEKKEKPKEDNNSESDHWSSQINLGIELEDENNTFTVKLPQWRMLLNSCGRIISSLL